MAKKDESKQKSDEPKMKDNVLCMDCGNEVRRTIAKKAFDDVGRALCQTCYNKETVKREQELSDRRKDAARKADEPEEVQGTTEVAPEAPKQPEYEVVNPPAVPAAAVAPAPAVIQRTVQVAAKQFTPKEIATIKDTVAKGASDSELAMFLHVCNTYGLDPFLKELYYSADMKTILTSRDGYLKVAQRDPAFEGIQSMAVCKNDEFQIDVQNHTVIHKFGRGDRGSVIGAWAIVYKRGLLPVISYADFNEYNRNNNIWKRYKSAMICKVAEIFALKRQFGITGLVTEEEIAKD